MINRVNTLDTNDSSGASIQDMAMLCAERNACVMSCYERGSVTLDGFLAQQASKVSFNKTRKTIYEPSDFYESAEEFITERLGDKAGKDIAAALEANVILTADHHGAVFCSQSFQGDILYGFLLRKLGVQGRIIPIFSGGQVELGNVTFARGINLYVSDESKGALPFFRAVDHNQMAIKAKAIDEEMLERFRNNFITENPDDTVKKTLEELLKTIYETDLVRKCRNYSEQVTAIGAMLSGKLFPEETGFTFAYLEVERVIKKILIKELGDENSILHRVMFFRSARKIINEITTEDGLPIASQLFVGADSKGRKVFLRLSESGELIGESRDGSKVQYIADPDNIKGLLEREEIYPGIFIVSVLLAFERGITWMGGMFQSVYLPSWQKTVMKLLNEMGMKEEADIVGGFDCTGYISGPMYALFGGDGYATTAGPVEMLMTGCNLSFLKSSIEKTTLWNAHMIGLHEMYPDLTVKNERKPDWYKTAAQELFGCFMENIFNAKTTKSRLG